MRPQPRTPVTYFVPKLRAEWVSFAWDASRPQLNDVALRHLDDVWDRSGFTGAAVVHPMDDDLRGRVRPKPCHDRWLTLNVLLRVRGHLLLSEMPPLDDGAAVAGVAVTTDDPRLVALAEVGR